MASPIRVVLAACLVGSASPPQVAASGQAAIGSYGFDTTGMDQSVKPGDDFNAYANGAWTKRTTIPSDHAGWSNFQVLIEQAREQTRDTLDHAAQSDAPAGSDVRKIGDFYASFMDEATIEQLGAAPLKAQLAAIAAISDFRQLARAMGEAIRVDDSMPFSVRISPDLKRPDRSISYIGQGALGLPDRDYYLKDDANMGEARAAYLAYAAKMLLLSAVAASDAEAATRARAVFTVEHRLAEIQWSRVQMRDVLASYNPWNRADYAVKAPGFDWNEFFGAAGLADQPVIVAGPASALVVTASIITTVPLPVWRDYMTIRAIDRHAPFLSKPFVDAHFEFHEKALEGTAEPAERWRRGTEFAQTALGEAIGRLYVQEHFPASAKAAAQELVNNLLVATRHRIDGLDWMSPETKAKAREKLAAFTTKIGYPDKWRDYSRLAVSRGDAYGNALAADRFEYERNLAKTGHPVDRSEWPLAPMEVNAYYGPEKNEIVFPAAILQPPFFDANADAAVNYGGIGFIIGHEISHAFDDRGRRFDGRGALKDWWTSADAARYKQRTEALVAQYGDYEALPGLKINGQLTLGENIADNNGIVVAYDAYHAALAGKPAPLIDGTTGDQRFFLGYAQSWRAIYRERATRELVATDPHTLTALRVRAVRNADPWYAAFDVKPGDALYLAPGDRVHIW